MPPYSLPFTIIRRRQPPVLSRRLPCNPGAPNSISRLHYILTALWLNFLTCSCIIEWQISHIRRGANDAIMINRGNEEWIASLRAQGEPAQDQALADLRLRLQRGIYFYLSQDRSDLRGLSAQELAQMSEDLAQDATLRVMDNLDNFRGESRFTTWANKIAIRLAISDLRRARYKDFSLDELTAEGELLPVSSRLATAIAPTPEKVAERDDVMEKIEIALKEALTERQYQALVAIALKGIPMDVLAERMDTNRNALYKLIHDARRKLKNHLEAQGISTDYMMNLFGN